MKNKNTPMRIITQIIVIILILIVSFVVVYILIKILTLDLTLDNSKTEVFINFIYRVGFFFLTSIVSLSILGNNFKKMLAPATAFETNHYKYMLIAIPFSILMIVSTFFLSLDESCYLNRIYIIFTKISFIIVSVVFLCILYEFLNSFNVKKTLNKNLKKIYKYGLFKETKHTDSKLVLLVLEEKNLNKLKVHIEKYVQNLTYLLKTKNDDILNFYLEEWRGVLSIVCTMIFHSKSQISPQLKMDFYATIIKYNTIIMLEAGNSLELKESQNKLITNLFKTLPDLREKEDSLDHLLNAYRYEKSYEQLIKIHFKEVYEAINKLYKSSNPDVYRQLANLELDFLNQYSSENYGAINKVLKKNFDKSPLIEDFLIATIFDLIENDKSKELPTIFEMIFKLSEQEDQSFISKPKGLLSLTKKPKESSLIKSRKSVPIKSRTMLNLTDKMLKGCIYAIIKANEIENYKSAGYIVKALCQNNIPDSKIKSIIEEIDKEIDSNIKFNIQDSQVNLNSFSLRYCFKKTFVLFYLQFKMNDKEFIKYEDYMTKVELNYLEEKLESKSKEYNLISIKKNEVLKKLAKEEANKEDQ